MARNYIGVIKLAPHVRAWADPKNKIHLVNNGRYFKCILDDYDLEPIMKGLKEGLIVETTAFKEGTADADDGARLPRYCGYNMCQLHLIKEAVAADYLEDVDFKSSLEWQPPQPAEIVKKPVLIISGMPTDPAVLEAGGDHVLTISIPEFPVVEQEQQVDADGDGLGDVDEEGNPIMEVVQVKQPVTVSIAVQGGSVNPASITFDPAIDESVMSGEVTLTINAGVESVKVTASASGFENAEAELGAVAEEPEEPTPEEPPADAVNPVVLINGQKDVIEIARGTTSFDAAITIEYGDCSADQLTLAEIEITLENKAATNTGYAGTDGKITVLDNTTISGICQPKSGDECVAAELHICGVCKDGTHQIDQTIQIKVPAMKGFLGGVPELEVFWYGTGDPYFVNDPNYFNDKLTMDIDKKEKWSIDDGAEFKGTWYLILPADSPLRLKAYDISGGDVAIIEHGPVTMAGVDYKWQGVALASGKGGISLAIV